MKITIPATFSAEIEMDDLAAGVLQAALSIAGNPETADFDLKTDDHGNTYVDNGGWQVSSDPRVAALVDAHYHLLGEPPMKLTDLEVARDRQAAERGDHPQPANRGRVIGFPGKSQA